jgi:hypothetical protein
LDKCTTCSYRDLVRHMEKRLDRRLSPDVFNLHIGNLTRAKILNRQPAVRRGQKVIYSLTDVAKKQVQLKLIAHPKQSIFTKIFQKFFFYEVYYSPRKVISTEKEFDKFLSEINITRKQLTWGLWSGAGAETNDVIATEIYRNPGGISARARKSHNVAMKEYWMMKNGQSRVVEDINFICSLKQNNINIAITKIERWEINKNSSHKKFRTKYMYELPGVSIEEFIINKRLGEKFKLADVEQAFDILRKNHLIEVAAVVSNQIRFKIVDDALIEIIRDIHETEYSLLRYKWQHFDEPSVKEVDRWSLLMGEDVASGFFKTMELERRTYKKRETSART